MCPCIHMVKEAQWQDHNKTCGTVLLTDGQEIQKMVRKQCWRKELKVTQLTNGTNEQVHRGGSLDLFKSPNLASLISCKSPLLPGLIAAHSLSWGSLKKKSYLCVPAVRGHNCCVLATSGSYKIGNIMSYIISMGRHWVYAKEAGV